MKNTTYGSAAALTAFVGWGITPLFWTLLNHIPPLVLIFHRFFWSAVIMWTIQILQNRVRQTLRVRPVMFRLLLSSLLLFINWIIFILAIQAQQTISASLGYALSPLFNVVIAVIFFREGLKKLEWVALFIAIIGILYFLLVVGGFSLFSLGMAVSFSAYGAVKKTIPLPGLQSFTWEMSINTLISLASVYVCISPLNITGSSLLPLAGLVTAVPLGLYNVALQKIPYARLAFFQYIAPSLMFLVSVFLLQEHLPLSHSPGYVIIWVSLLVYISAQYRCTKQSA